MPQGPFDLIIQETFMILVMMELQGQKQHGRPLLEVLNGGSGPPKHCPLLSCSWECFTDNSALTVNTSDLNALHSRQRIIAAGWMFSNFLPHCFHNPVVWLRLSFQASCPMLFSSLEKTTLSTEPPLAPLSLSQVILEHPGTTSTRQNYVYRYLKK